MKSTMVAGLLASLLLTAGAARAAEPGTARVDSGVLQGAVEGAIASFKGVPFAAPPTGELRWAPPRRATAWTGPRAATAFGPACPQGPVVAALLAGAASGPASEDCLTLNVWAPVGAKRAPVMVWLHGGGNQQGSGSIPYYDGSSFARDGVVLVSINYRLGPLGFFAHPSLTKEARGGATGNYGLMDQVAALQWVKRNIAAFGGDPGKVTVFGESAGGGDILMLMTAPSANGLFQQAIVESGGGWSGPRSLADAEARGRAAAQAANLPAEATAAQLRALPVSALDAPAFRQASGPMLDGRLITTSPAEAFAAGREADLPLIIGSNAGEDSLMGPGQGATMLGRLSPERLAALKAAYPGADDALLARNQFRDSVMGAPARWIAARAASGAPAWLYHFAYVPPALKVIYPRTPHGGEVPFLFETLDKVPAPPGMIAEADRAMAHKAHSCWVAFAKTGAPTCEGGPAWPPYTPTGDATLVFDASPHVETGFMKGPYAVQEAAFAERRPGSGREDR